MDFQRLLAQVKENLKRAKDKIAQQKSLLHFLKRRRHEAAVTPAFGAGGEDAPSLFDKDPIRKRRGLMLPKWAKKDWFSRKDLGTMVPPEELMPRSHVKRSGDWLRKKLKGTDRAQQFETVEAGKVLSQKTEGSSDREIEQFLSGYLSQPGGKSRKRPFPRSRKRAK